MIWELVATVFAGLGGAGIALLIRKLSKQAAPKWLVPAFAGLCMLGFQVQGEYDWYDHQTGLLPTGVVVVKAVEEKAIWRPWSYVFPQTTRFIAADVANHKSLIAYNQLEQISPIHSVPKPIRPLNGIH